MIWHSRKLTDGEIYKSGVAFLDKKKPTHTYLKWQLSRQISHERVLWIGCRGLSEPPTKGNKGCLIFANKHLFYTGEVIGVIGGKINHVIARYSAYIEGALVFCLVNLFILMSDRKKIWGKQLHLSSLAFYEVFLFFSIFKTAKFSSQETILL